MHCQFRIRATSKSEPPEIGDWEVADKSLFRMAWQYAFAQARRGKKDETIKAFQTASLSVAVTFKLLVSDDEFGQTLGWQGAVTQLKPVLAMNLLHRSSCHSS